MVRRILVVTVLLGMLSVPAFANHAWGSYHWGSTVSPVPLKVGDNVTSAWDSYLDQAIADWDKSTKLALTKVAGQSSKRCGATAGRIEVCNGTYGQNGWLGLASIWASGSHITQATAKMNDTYYAMSTYNKPEWRDMVMCQEVGHDFGLGHQDENQTNPNLGTCMDYTNCPSCSPSNLAPNAHDYSQLDTIYNHTDSTNTWSATFGGVALTSLPVIGDDITEPWTWGTPVEWDPQGRAVTFERELSPNHEGVSQRVLTHVFWAPFEDGFERPVVDTNK